MAQITTPNLALRASPNSSAQALRVSNSYSMIVTSTLRFFQYDSIFDNPFGSNLGWIFGNNFTYTVELWLQKINLLAQLNDPNRITCTKLASKALLVKPGSKNFQGLAMEEKTIFLTGAILGSQLSSTPGESVFGMIRLVNNTNGLSISATTALKPV